MGQSKELFNLVNNYLGWGDPQGGIWFCGLEEAATWPPGSAEEIRRTCSKPYEAVTARNWQGNGGRAIRDYTSKICSQLSESYRGKDWHEYSDQVLWAEGYQVFQTNLLSLGKPNLKDWPVHYKELFGFGPEDRDAYQSTVRETRFPAINTLWKKSSPQVTICFGIAGWPDFKALFNLDTLKAEFPYKDVACYQEKKIILCPFLGQGMSDERADIIVKQCREWKVNIK